eukprot:UN03757
MCCSYNISLLELNSMLPFSYWKQLLSYIVGEYFNPTLLSSIQSGRQGKFTYNDTLQFAAGLEQLDKIDTSAVGKDIETTVVNSDNTLGRNPTRVEYDDENEEESDEDDSITTTTTTNGTTTLASKKLSKKQQQKQNEKNKKKKDAMKDGDETDSDEDDSDDDNDLDSLLITTGRGRRRLLDYNPLCREYNEIIQYARTMAMDQLVLTHFDASN